MGYLVIDNRTVGGTLEEYDTKACKHCGGVVKVFRPPYTHRCSQGCKAYGCDHEQYYCARCDGMLCLHCGRKSYLGHGCEIYLREMEKALAKLQSGRAP